jgi:uncharacterized RDD family membrane protein YckC
MPEENTPTPPPPPPGGGDSEPSGLEGHGNPPEGEYPPPLPPPPPSGGYRQPPTGAGYGTPPAPGGYGTPPAPGGYGTPPAPGGYGGPPASGGYSAAPAYGEPFAPTVPLGSWIQRVAGYIIDDLVLLPGAIITAIALTAGSRGVDPQTGATTYSAAALGFAAIGGLIALVLGAWNRWFRAGRTGQSVGKQVMGLKLVSERTGQPIGAGMAFVRDLAHIIDNIICYIGWLFPLWDAKRQTIADKLVGTLVYDIGKR